MFVTDKDPVEDKFADGDVCQISQAAVLTHCREQLDSLLGN